MVVSDYLTCGSCHREFLLSNIVVFIEHKKANCDVSMLSSLELTRLDSSLERFLCSSCPEKFSAAVTLLQHAQQMHNMNIFLEDGLKQPPEQQPTTETSTENGEVSDKVDGAQSDVDDKERRKTADSKSQFQLEKCCNSVIPKKRTRHVETKHLKSRTAKRKDMLGERGTIYIDFESSDDVSDKEPSFTAEENQEKSVILQPGSTYSIPVSYYSALPSSVGALTSSTQTSVIPSRAPLKAPEGEHIKNTVVKKPIANLQDASPSMECPGELEGNSKKRRYPTSKPFKCNQCDHSFNQRIHLKKHLSKHTGIKPYKCQQCDYSTVERSHLKVHIRIHTGEKPFKCTYCEYATAQNSTLKIHLKRHHSSSASSITCSLCGVKFPQPELLDSHQKEHQTPDLNTLADVCVKDAEAMMEDQEAGATTKDD